MGDAMSHWFATAMPPQGDCYAWNMALVWSRGVSNAIIGLSFVSIALTLAYLVHAGKSLPFKCMAVAFGTFIISCGLTHFLDAVVIWQPWYWFDASVRAVTALASL